MVQTRRSWAIIAGCSVGAQTASAGGFLLKWLSHPLALGGLLLPWQWLTEPGGVWNGQLQMPRPIGTSASLCDYLMLMWGESRTAGSKQELEGEKQGWENELGQNSEGYRWDLQMLRWEWRGPVSLSRVDPAGSGNSQTVCPWNPGYSLRHPYFLWIFTTNSCT